MNRVWGSILTIVFSLASFTAFADADLEAHLQGYEPQFDCRTQSEFGFTVWSPSSVEYFYCRDNEYPRARNIFYHAEHTLSCFPSYGYSNASLHCRLLDREARSGRVYSVQLECCKRY